MALGVLGLFILESCLEYQSTGPSRRAAAAERSPTARFDEVCHVVPGEKVAVVKFYMAGTMLIARAATGLPARLAPRAPLLSRVVAARPMSSLSRMETPLNLGVVVVPQQMAYVVERFGRFHTVLEPGLRLLVPFVCVLACTLTPFSRQGSRESCSSHFSLFCVLLFAGTRYATSSLSRRKP